MTDKKSPVTVDRCFEVGFSLPRAQVTRAPPGATDDLGPRTLDRVVGEGWRLMFPLEDAITIAETFSAVAAKIIALAKENPPK